MLRNIFAGVCLLVHIVSSPALYAGETIFFNSELDTQTVENFIKKHNGKDLSTLEIHSPGGEVEAGIRLGLWVHKQKLDIVVKNQCLSSCANYVFTAGRNKRVMPGAVVAWHGNYHHLDKTGLWRDDVSLRMRRDGEDEATATRTVRKQVDKLVSLEKDFFATVNVDEQLCWIGKQPPHNVPDYYTLSVKDMARFGVTNVSQSWESRTYDSGKFKGAYINVVHIDLP